MSSGVPSIPAFLSAATSVGAPGIQVLSAPASVGVPGIPVAGAPMSFGAPGIPVSNAPNYPRAAKTYLCYGIPVTNESITYATMAYKKLERPFRFIRLVQQRIREGTLQTAQTSAVGLIPVELWDLVRHEITDLELRAAERKFLETHACDDCCQQPYHCGCSSRQVKEWADLLQCPACLDNVHEYEGFGDPALAKKCRLLLHNYGLDLPSTTTLKYSQPGSWRPANGDPVSVAFVAVSPSSPIDAGDHVSCEHPKVDAGDNFHNDGIWPVSLDKPVDADQRFRHLLRDLHLTPLEVSDGSIGIARATDPTHGRTYKKISADEVKPQWHLFTTVVCDW